MSMTTTMRHKLARRRLLTVIMGIPPLRWANLRKLREPPGEALMPAFPTPTVIGMGIAVQGPPLQM